MTMPDGFESSLKTLRDQLSKEFRRAEDTAASLAAARRELADVRERMEEYRREWDSACGRERSTFAELKDRREEVQALARELAEARAERDAYRKAKAENDERFMLERDEARAERDRFKAAAQKEMQGMADKIADLCRERNAAEASAEKLRGALRRVHTALENIPGYSYRGTTLWDEARAALSGTAAPRGIKCACGEYSIPNHPAAGYAERGRLHRVDGCTTAVARPRVPSATARVTEWIRRYEAETAPPPSGPDHSSSPVAVHDLCRPNDGNGSGPERRSAAGETATPRSAGGTAPDVAGGDRAERRPLSPPASAGDNLGAAVASMESKAAPAEAARPSNAIPSAAPSKPEPWTPPGSAVRFVKGLGAKPEPGAPCSACEAERKMATPTMGYVLEASLHASTCPRYRAPPRAAVPEEPRARCSMCGGGHVPGDGCRAAAPKVEDPLGDPFPTFESFVLRWAPSPPSAGAQFKAEAWALFIRDRSRLAALEEVARRARGWGNPELTAALAALDSLVVST